MRYSGKLHETYMCYNSLGSIANHCLDLSEIEYKIAGVSRLHNKTLVPEDVKKYDRVFVKGDLIYNGVFQREYLPKIKNKFVLLSGASDYDLSKGFSISEIINNPLVIKWFCTNAKPNISNKIFPTPIGFQEKERVGGKKEVLDVARKFHKNFKEKKNAILLPYHNVSNDPSRKKLIDKLKSLPFVDYMETKCSFTEYLNWLNHYKFVFCLRGNGEDVHRFYETLLVGSVPVGIDSSIKYLFETHRLPGHFIEDIENIDDSFMKKDFNFKDDDINPFLTVGYHSDLVFDFIERDMTDD